MKKNISIFVVIFLGLSFNAFGQVRAINNGEFYSAMRAAGEKRFKFSRREKVKETLYTKGKIREIREFTEEFLIPGKQRYLSVETRDGKVEKLELIKIGETNYQRENDGKWRKEAKWNAPMVLKGIPAPANSSYSSEPSTIDNQPAVLYKFYAVFNESSPSAGEEKQGFYDEKVWVNSDGLIVRKEVSMGKPLSKEITFAEVYENEYDPKDLKIEAPVTP